MNEIRKEYDEIEKELEKLTNQKNELFRKIKSIPRHCETSEAFKDSLHLFAMLQDEYVKIDRKLLSLLIRKEELLKLLSD